MGDQKDGLRGLTRFSDNEGDIIWPAWRAELKQRVAFEFGKIGNQIIEGEVKESDVDSGEVTEKINALVNALIPKTRAQIQTRSDWMEEFIESSEEGASDEVCSIKKTKLTLIGKMSVVSAISRIKSSYFESIQEHGLVRGSKVAKDLKKKKLNYVDTTLPQWFVKMDAASESARLNCLRQVCGRPQRGQYGTDDVRKTTAWSLRHCTLTV